MPIIKDMSRKAAFPLSQSSMASFNAKMIRKKRARKTKKWVGASRNMGVAAAERQPIGGKRLRERVVALVRWLMQRIGA